MKGWDLPRRCQPCRELFRHKPFRTVRETDALGSVVFRTYNSIGQLIGESRDNKDWLGNERRTHRSASGRMTGESRQRTDLLGNAFTESRGGSSGTRHTTTDRTTWLGTRYRSSE